MKATPDETVSILATYRDAVTTALRIDPSSCALDVVEAIEALQAARDELRLTLAAEQGHEEGAPSGWARTIWLWQRRISEMPPHVLEVSRAPAQPEAMPWEWRIYRPVRVLSGFAATARAAMIAADLAASTARG